MKKQWFLNASLIINAESKEDALKAGLCYIEAMTGVIHPPEGVNADIEGYAQLATERDEPVEVS